MTSSPNSDIPTHGDTVFFSVIVPVYNRETLIRRTLDSCLSQDFKDYEIVVVDDASEDNSVAVVESYVQRYPNITLVKSAENRGLCGARGLGAAHARGKWIMFIDSDDTFHPGAFQTIYKKTCSIPEEVSEVRFCYWSEEYNQVTPIPLMPKGIIGFVEYLHWLDGVKNADVFYCHRREVYDEISWPEDRRYSWLFFLELASKFQIMMFEQVVGTMHNDAENRNTALKRGPYPNMFPGAYDNAVGMSEALIKFGDELRRHCPNKYRMWKRTIGYFYLKAGYRLKGCRYIIPYLIRNPFDIAGWARFVLGLMGPAAILRLGKTFRTLGEKLCIE